MNWKINIPIYNAKCKAPLEKVLVFVLVPFHVVSTLNMCFEGHMMQWLNG